MIFKIYWSYISMSHQSRITITWNDLCLQDKAIILCDDHGFWDPLLTWFAGASAKGAIRPGATRRFYSVASLDALFALLETELQISRATTT